MKPADITRRIQAYNSAPVADFCGLSPNQMHTLASNPLEPGSPVALRAALPDEVLNQVPLLGLTEAFLGILQREGSLKLTALGALPRKYLHELYALGLLREADVDSGLIKLNREIDSTALTTVHLNTVLAGLARKAHGKLALTKKGEALRQPEQRPALLRLVLDTFANRFNWAYFDRYDSATAGQSAWAYSIYLLLKFGDEPRPIQFYADLYQRAFPFVLATFPDVRYMSREQQLASCYSNRVFFRFTHWFGLVEMGERSYRLDGEGTTVAASALLPQLFSSERSS